MALDESARSQGTSRTALLTAMVSFTLYNFAGQAMQQTNPTEMDHAWAVGGDDAVGWYSTSQTYDWKGRLLVTTNTDDT
jgi:hypothetical protein